MNRYLEGRVRPRVLVLTYLASLVAAVLATLMLLTALFIRYLPHEYLARAGLECRTESGVCAAALPPWATPTVSFLVGGIGLGLLLFAAIALVNQLTCSGRQGCEIVRSARPYRGHVLLVNDSAPVSYTFGFLRPFVVISTGLLAALDRDEVEAVLAHEEGHVRARDNLVTLIGQTLALTFVLVPGVRFAQTRLRQAQELAADDFARSRTGNGLVVASGLQKFARFTLEPRPAAAAGFANEGNVPERIRGLLADDVVRTCRRRVVTVVLAFVFLFVAFGGSAVGFTDVTVAGSGDCASCHHDQPAGSSQVHGCCSSR